LSSLDVHMLGSFDQSAFWQLVLQPLVSHFPSNVIRDVYETSLANKYGTYTLETLFDVLQDEGWRVVLLLDEFDALLTHPILNSVEFYGSLRSLASRYTSLALIISSRRSLDFLNQNTQGLNPHGSPYFNIFSEIRLGPLPLRDSAELLARADTVFDKHDRRFLFEISGRHPFLLQLAADCLWEVHHRPKLGNQRYEVAAREFYDQSQLHFWDTWRTWSNDERKVITAIALYEIPFLVERRTFQQNSLIRDLDDYTQELRGLEKGGAISKNSQGVWIIAQEALLWWLADEIRRATRDNADFTEWLQKHQFDGLFTRQEREKWGRAAKTVGNTLGKGVSTLIESFAKGFGEGIGKTIAGGP
jgi:hypothetical protein